MEYWQEQIRDRLEHFQHSHRKDGFAISIKIRVTSGCFCRGCCPAGNRIVDEYRQSHPLDPRYSEFVEHESGPELLLYLALGAAALGLARESLSIVKSAIELVTVIVKARSEGQKQGDRQHDPLIIIVRGLDSTGTFYEKQVLEVPSLKPSTKETIDKSLLDVIQLVAEERVRQQS